jgi:hypothetical protein
MRTTGRREDTLNRRIEWCSLVATPEKMRSRKASAQASWITFKHSFLTHETAAKWLGFFVSLATMQL